LKMPRHAPSRSLALGVSGASWALR
jgi:hypothetical protein